MQQQQDVLTTDGTGVTRELGNMKRGHGAGQPNRSFKDQKERKGSRSKHKTKHTTNI